MLIDPKSASTENLVMNMMRQVDDIIIDGALKDAKTSGGADAAFPSTQIVGDYSAEISLDMVTEVDEKFQANDIDPDEERYWIIGPKQRRKMLQLVEVVSGDYQASKALATGYLPNWMGFNWILSNRLNVPLADQLDNLVFTKKALGLHVAGDIRSRVAERPDMSFAWQVYMMMNMDCVRVQDEHIVHAKVKDTVA